MFRSGGESEEADIRPTLLGVVTLMFLLLFFLLSTSSGTRLAVLDLRLLSPEEMAPLPHNGLLKSVTVTMNGQHLHVEAELQTTDISAAATTVEKRSFDVPPTAAGKVDLATFQAALLELHTLDRSQEEAELAPDDAVTVEELFQVMDIIRGPAPDPWFPKLALTGAGA